MEREKREKRESENFEFILMYFVQLMVNGGLEEDEEKKK